MRAWHFLRRITADRRGNIGMAFALLAGPIILTCGAAVDYSRIEQFKTQLQATVDSAALAGAAVYTNSGASSNAQTVAGNYITANVTMLPAHVGSVSQSVSANATTAGNTVTVTATVTVGTTFVHMIMPSVAVSASASAVNPTTRVCFLITDPSSSQALLVNGGASLNAPNCEIDVASTSATAAMIDSSLPNIAGMCVGGYATLNSATVNNLNEQCTAATNPYVNAIATPSISTACNFSNQNYSGNVSLSPGTYCGSINFNGGGTVTFGAGNYVFYNATVNFNSTGTLSFGAGVYSLKGTSWNINTGWTATGTGVTFYYADASSYIQLNSGVKANLAAPTSGTYSGILIFEPDGLATSSFAIDSTSTTDLLQGLIYLPSRNITFNSTANVTSDAMTLVAHQVIFDAVSWSVTPSAKSLSGQSSGKNHLAS